MHTGPKYFPSRYHPPIYLLFAPANENGYVRWAAPHGPPGLDAGQGYASRVTNHMRVECQRAKHAFVGEHAIAELKSCASVRNARDTLTSRLHLEHAAEMAFEMLVMGEKG